MANYFATLSVYTWQMTSQVSFVCFRSYMYKFKYQLFFNLCMSCRRPRSRSGMAWRHCHSPSNMSTRWAWMQRETLTCISHSSVVQICGSTDSNHCQCQKCRSLKRTNHCRYETRLVMGGYIDHPPDSILAVSPQ